MGRNLDRSKTGRKAGTPNKCTSEIRALASAFGPDTIGRLVILSKNDANPGAAVAACRELLDRGYGKSPQPIDGDGQGGPVTITVITGVPRA